MQNFKTIGGGPWKNGQKSDDLTWNDPGGKSHKLYAKWLEAQSEPVPAVCVNKQHYSVRSPSRSLPSDKLYRYQLLLTTKLGELVAFLRNCLACMCKLIL